MTPFDMPQQRKAASNLAGNFWMFSLRIGSSAFTVLGILGILGAAANALPTTSSQADSWTAESEHFVQVPCIEIGHFPNNPAILLDDANRVHEGDLCVELFVTFQDALFGADVNAGYEHLRPDLDGTLTPKSYSLIVTIPPGIVNNARLRLSGSGNADAEGTFGDLYLYIRTPSEAGAFRREDNDIFSTLVISAEQANLGTEATVPTVDGGQASLTIPPNTRPGEQFIIPGEGVPYLTEPGRRGNHIVTVEF